MAKRGRQHSDGFLRFLLVRVLPGIGLIAIALLLSRRLERPLGPAPRQGWRQLVWVAANGAPGAGGLFYILLGWPGLAGGAGLALFFALISILPQPWDRLMLVATIGLCLLAPLLLKSRRRAKEAAPPAEGAEGEGAVRASSGAPYGSALVYGTGLGIAYQFFASPEELRFYRVGNLLTGADEALLQRADAPLRKLDRRDFRIAARDVEKLRFMVVEYRGLQLRMLARANGRTRSFALMMSDPKGNEFAFLDALRDFAQDKREDPDGLFEIGPRLAQFDLARARRLKVALAALVALAVAVQPAWLLADAPYRPFAVLSLLPFPILFALCLLFPNELSLWGNKLLAGGRARASMLLIGTSFVPLGRAILDFRFLDWRRLVLLSALLAVAPFLAFLLRKRE